MKDIMDLHRWGKLELVRNWSDPFGDGKWSIPFWGEFLISGDGQVASFEPNLVSFLHLRCFLIIPAVLDVGQQLLG